MALEHDLDPMPHRSFPYHAGWRAMACGAFFFGVLGGVGAAMLPFGCEQNRAGRLPLAVALWIIGGFGIPMLFFALFAIYAGIRDSIAPPLLRLTTSSLVLPAILRQRTCEEEEIDDRGEPKNLDETPAHPELIPFIAIRSVRRENAPRIGTVMTVMHDLSEQSLVIEQSMMNREDFDELGTILRAAIPAAFAPAPPSS
jgi:hypothetical protein